MDWQRARTDEKKNERRDAILEAAFILFKKKGYEKVSFNGIAVEAGFTKSNMYRYFHSKEEIFLNIFSSLFVQWFEDCCKSLRKTEQGVSIENFSKMWVKTLVDHPRLLDLKPILFIALENNSSFEELIEFKTLAKGLLYEIAVEISRIFPELEGEKAFKFLTLSYAATSNSWAATFQSEALKKVYQLEEFKILRPDFNNDLTSSIEIIIHGLTSMSNK
ncbi:MAG: TetR family transcriptional regulator [Bacteriovorax sp. MedPE-SWde]|nr:MAG: TetR family transcriptional regulator [Bacteriovorax sp. MedPE-SWde]